MTPVPLQNPERDLLRDQDGDVLLLHLDLNALEQQFFLEWQVPPDEEAGEAPSR